MPWRRMPGRIARSATRWTPIRDFEPALRRHLDAEGFAAPCASRTRHSDAGQPHRPVGPLGALDGDLDGANA